jgi:hypothetical protein
MSLTSLLGYGQFELGDFAPGELFARFDGSLAMVCDPQPVGRPDHIFVWTNYGASNAERLWLHRTAQAYAICEEEAWTIERRRREAT